MDSFSFLLCVFVINSSLWKHLYLAFVVVDPDSAAIVVVATVSAAVAVEFAVVVGGVVVVGGSTVAILTSSLTMDYMHSS